MRILWLDINSSYSHSSLAIPALHAQLEKGIESRHKWRVISGTPKKEISYYTDEIEKFRPDYIFSTLWLFNHKFVINLLEKAKKSFPEVTIVLGGPEFLGNNCEFLKKERFIDAVFRGEGEDIYPQFIEKCDIKGEWGSLKGFCYLDKNGEYIDNGYAIAEGFSSLTPPENSQLFILDKPFVQLETSRGCFNKCRFCVSGNKNRVRNIPLKSIEIRINYLKSKGVRDIRILDRTFNANEARAVNMLSIFERFPEIRFHLEIHPAFLGKKFREKLISINSNNLHLEAGVQSLNNNVLKECNRKGNAFDTIDGIKFLVAIYKFETHCDLIAGLPLYTYTNLVEDFLILLTLDPSEIQLELLKVLPGTEFRSDPDKFNIKYSSTPPYEIIESSWITSEQLGMAGILSNIIESYYNRSIWREIFRKIMLDNSTNITKFISFIIDCGSKFNINNEKKGDILFKFCNDNCNQFIEDIIFTWMKNGLSYKSVPGKLSGAWKVTDKLPNPVYETEYPGYSYRYVE
jgi:radical SAM superfamily enzyme YgiQ (UPF0313 family)